jgi:hypothetical protein
MIKDLIFLNWKCNKAIVPRHLNISKIKNGYLVGDVYCQNKKEILEYLTLEIDNLIDKNGHHEN